MAWQGKGMGTAWARHAMCESAFSLLIFLYQVIDVRTDVDFLYK
jgi:hypothetical protein